jgi:hypothetical protein
MGTNFATNWTQKKGLRGGGGQLHLKENNRQLFVFQSHEKKSKQMFEELKQLFV